MIVRLMCPPPADQPSAPPQPPPPSDEEEEEAEEEEEEEEEEAPPPPGGSPLGKSLTTPVAPSAFTPGTRKARLEKEVRPKGSGASYKIMLTALGFEDPCCFDEDEVPEALDEP